MPAAGTRRASTPSRLPIHTQRWPRARSTVATATPGNVCPPVPPPAIKKREPVTLCSAGGMPLEGELDEAVDQRRVVDAGRLPHLRVAARAREPGDRVDLVHVDPVVLQKE